MSGLEQFHFLRPGWLLLLLPLLLVAWKIVWRGDQRRMWVGIIDEHLLDELLIQPKQEKKRTRPVLILMLAMALGVTALAGPAWQLEDSPFTEDQAALVIVLKVSPEMLASDIQPSRLHRANHKIKDLLTLRPGTRNALIAYAGSAHLVMPLTSDAGVIQSFADALSPELMPVPGDSAAEAVALANRQLADAGVAGSILLISDAVDAGQLAGLAELRQAEGADVHLLAMAAGPEVIPPPDSPPAPALDEAAFTAAERAAGGSLTLVSIDDQDVKRLVSNISNSFANAPLQQGTRWRDEGYFLLPLLAVLMLMFFRSGGAVQTGYSGRTGQ